MIKRAVSHEDREMLREVACVAQSAYRGTYMTQVHQMEGGLVRMYEVRVSCPVCQGSDWIKKHGKRNQFLCDRCQAEFKEDVHGKQSGVHTDAMPEGCFFIWDIEEIS